MDRKHTLFPPKLIIGAFFISALYWAYLFFTTRMFISADAIGFERLGDVIYRNGWVEFFKTGPNREPLYPLTIAISMYWADCLNISYQTIQKIFHIFLLFTTAFLVYKILKKLKMSNIIIALTLIYFGFSPAIVNSAFSLFCEIMTYPFILGIVFISTAAWQAINNDKLLKIILLGLGLATLFVLLTLIKAIAEIILFVFLLPFYYRVIKAVITKHKKQLMGSLVFLVVTILTTQACLISYKKLNQKYNGHFTITDRGSWLMYGNIARRTEQLKPRQFLSAFAYAHGEGLCQTLFPQEECAFWSFKEADGRGLTKLNELRGQGVAESEIDSRLIRVSISKISENPFQFAVLMAIENLKMIFWESTKLGYVAYPTWLEKIFDFVPFKNGLRLAVYLITIFSLICLVRYTWQQRAKFDEDTSLIFFLLVFLFSYIMLYSVVCVVARYIIPIAPLYLIGIAFCAQKIIFKR